MIKLKTILYISALSILCIVTYYSLMPSDHVELPTNDKVGHFLAYVTLSFNLYLLLKKEKKWPFVLAFSIAYGLLLEFLQGFVPGRSPSIADIFANSGGVIIGTLLNFFTGQQIRKRLL